MRPRSRPSPRVPAKKRRRRARRAGRRRGAGRPRDDGTNVPDTYRPLTSPGRVGADDAAALRAIRAREAVGAEERRPVPARPAAALVERALRPRLQRDEDARRREEHDAHAGADRRGEVLDPGQSRPGLAGGGAPARGREGARPRRDRAPVRAAQHGRRQHLHHRLGREVHLQFLAARSPRSATATRTATTRPSAMPAGRR